MSEIYASGMRDRVRCASGGSSPEVVDTAELRIRLQMYSEDAEKQQEDQPSGWPLRKAIIAGSSSSSAGSSHRNDLMCTVEALQIHAEMMDWACDPCS